MPTSPKSASVQLCTSVAAIMSEYYGDEWPTSSDGSEYDGLSLLELVRAGESPFSNTWDVNLLIREIEENLDASVVDIPLVNSGANNYGFQVQLSDGQDVVARMARGDVNMPNYDGFSLESQVAEVKFEAEVYEMLASHQGIKASHLLYYRAPTLCGDDKRSKPRSIVGRRLMLFKRNEGRTTGTWRKMLPNQQLDLVTQAAHVRAELFKFGLPQGFASHRLRDRLFEQKPRELPVPVASTRNFCMALFTSKVEATIKNVGDMIGWESDGNTVGPIAFAAKHSLLKFIPSMLPEESGDRPVLYRLVLEHGDFGIHNMTIDDTPRITSLFDWETGCIVPAILSDSHMAVAGANLVIDDDGNPAISRLSKNASIEDIAQYAECTRRYHEVLFKEVPEYEQALVAGKDARHLWFALRDWRGDDPEGYFGKLGAWAEERLTQFAK